MRHRFALLLPRLVLALAFSTPLFAGEAKIPAIIPRPQKLEVKDGFLLLARGKPGVAPAILVDSTSEETGRYLATQLGAVLGAKIPVVRESKGPGKRRLIRLTTKGIPASLGAEGYTLSVTPEEVVIGASDPAGLFYGAQTLLQLLPARSAMADKTDIQIPCVEIEDQPRFKWRGMMLDVSRHFFSKPEVEQLLDAMARYKLNTFHWHLVDDQGWRIEIKKYPKLTEMGAWRPSVGFGLDPKSAKAYGPDGRYGGYYTQADIREVVAYAAARHITIVPEIEMPGHSSAALMAYPQLSCTGGPFTDDLPGGVFNGVYCAGNNDSFGFVQDVLTEVFQLFPGKYIHIGGDEVPTTNWMNCARCQARMREEGFKKEGELEGYFIRRVEKFINEHQRNLIGWSEIREGGLAANATVMDWVGGAVEAAGAGHDVVMSPLADCYFDHYQSRDHSTEPHAIGGYLPLRQVYEFEPLPAKLPAQCEPHILGAQANVWTEYMPSLNHVEYMVFPRLCALAEVLWSPKDSRNWEDFAHRMQNHYTRLQELGVNYRHTALDGQETSSAR
jgi:hexosaminidase